MRYLVLSDIHSNIEALEACTTRAKQAGYDRVVCCGDIVGYGPNPSEVMDLLEELDTVSIRGNHDRAVSGISEPIYFNPAARQAVEWTRANLKNSYLDRLAQLPTGPLALTEQAELVHGSVRDEDEYVVNSGDAAINLALTATQMTFFGHTHEPSVFAIGGRRIPSYDGAGLAKVTAPAGKMLINPGSVGQPRDGDSRASFLIWDTSSGVFEFYRVKYAVAVTQARMRAVGLPEILAVRLALGR